MASETPSPTPPVLPLPNLPPLPPQLTPKSQRARAHARAPPHDLRARYFSAQRSALDTWDAVRRAAQYATLAGRTHGGHPPARSRSVNLYDPKNLSALLRLRTADLLALFELHYELRKQFRQRIAEPSLPTCSSPTRIATQYRKHDAGGSKMSVLCTRNVLNLR